MLRRALVLLLAAGLTAPAARKKTPLDEYVHTPDPAYKFELVAALESAGCTAAVLDMTSQEWKPGPVDRTVWKHWLTVIRPAKAVSATALLFISGGSNRDKPPAKPDAGLVTIATYTNSVVAELRMVPNQPLDFGDGKMRVEDDLIAYGWDKFLRGGEALWLARLPMTKAAVRAMDTVTAFSKTAAGGGIAIDRFVVSGGSKRGWTTWTTAAVDKRVAGIAPAVIDLLNLEKSFEHHWQAYGFWAPAVGDYVRHGVMDWIGRLEFRRLLDVVEPYSYRDRYTMPKYILNSAGDQFFIADSSRFYFDDLPGEKYLRYVPNSDHSLRNTDVRESLAAWYDALLNNRPRPRFGWKFEKDGAIRVWAKDKPAEVKLWQATNPAKRDFRLETLGPVYKGEALRESPAGVWVGKAERPAAGWTAYFVELTYGTGRKFPMKFTTAVRVTPETLPFPKPEPKLKAATAASGPKRP